MHDTVIQNIEHLKYVGVFAGAFIEGPTAALAGGLLVKSHFLAFIPTVLVHILGDFSADICYFFATRLGSSSAIKWLQSLFRFSDKKVQAMRQGVEQHHLNIIITGKLTHLLGLPAIIGIGLSKYSWKKFFLYDLIATIIKSTALVSIGFGVGALWKQEEAQISFVGISFMLILSLLLYFLQIRKNEYKV